MDAIMTNSQTNPIIKLLSVLCLNLYLVYVQEKHKKDLSEVLCCDFSQENIHGFMECLKNERSCFRQVKNCPNIYFKSSPLVSTL